MTNFEFKVLQMLEEMNKHLATLVAQGVESPRRTVRDDADAANSWARALETIRRRGGFVPYMDYETAHKEAAKAFADGSLSGGAFAGIVTKGDVRKAFAMITRLARKCDCGWADRCLYPHGLCPVERSGQYESPSKVAERIMAPLPVDMGPFEATHGLVTDLEVKAYDVISEGPGMRNPADVCRCGHSRRMHTVGLPENPCCARIDAETVCECDGFVLLRNRREGKA